MIQDIPVLLRRMKKALAEQTDIAVVGMSGGADSTLVTVLCAEFIGKTMVYGVHMPAVARDLETFNRNSMRVAGRLGVHSLLLPIGECSVLLEKALEGVLGGDLGQVNRGNARARMRMAGLYGVSHHLAGQFPDKRVRVIGTGNLSEDYIGYDTKGGDALADYFLIGDLFKSEVYQLLEYFRDAGVLDDDMIDRIPSAGLWSGQTDEGELGFTYDEMEVSIRKLLAGHKPGPGSSACDQFVWRRHLENKHKHQAPPVCYIGTSGKA